MTKFTAIAAATLMLAAAPFAVEPAAAASANVQIGPGHHGNHGYHGRRYVERRAIHRERCTMKTVVTHHHGQRVVRKIRTCR